MERPPRRGGDGPGTIDRISDSSVSDRPIDIDHIHHGRVVGSMHRVGLD